MFASFINSLTKGCTCSAQQGQPNVPTNQKPTAKPVQSAQKAAAQSASSSSSSSLSGKATFHVDGKNYLPASEKLTDKQKLTLLNVVCRDQDWPDEASVSTIHIGVEFARIARVFTVVIQEPGKKDNVQIIRNGEIGYTTIETVMRQAGAEIKTNNSNFIIEDN